MMNTIKRIINWTIVIALLVTTFFLFFRILLRLFGAESTSLFSVFIYSVSDVLLIPFFGMLDNFNLPQDSVFDFVAIFGLISYVTMYLLAMAVISIYFRIIKLAKKDTPVESQNNISSSY